MEHAPAGDHDYALFDVASGVYEFTFDYSGASRSRPLAEGAFVGPVRS